MRVWWGCDMTRKRKVCFRSRIWFNMHIRLLIYLYVFKYIGHSHFPSLSHFLDYEYVLFWTILSKRILAYVMRCFFIELVTRFIGDDRTCKGKLALCWSKMIFYNVLQAKPVSICFVSISTRVSFLCQKIPASKHYCFTVMCTTIFKRCRMNMLGTLINLIIKPTWLVFHGGRNKHTRTRFCGAICVLFKHEIRQTQICCVFHHIRDDIRIIKHFWGKL